MLRRCSAMRRMHASAFLHDVTQPRKSTKELVDEQERHGEDAASNLTQDFITLQFSLLRYRFIRLDDEIRAVLKAPTESIHPVGFLLTVAVAWVLYTVGVWVGRRSMDSLIEPAELKKE